MPCFLKNTHGLRVALLLACTLVLASGGRAETGNPGQAASAPLPTVAAMPLSIQQAVGLALKKNPGFQQAANLVESRTIDVAQRRADFAPDLGMTLAGAERFDKAIDPADGSYDNRNYEVASGALASTVNLFNGFGDIAALRGAEWELAGQKDSFTREEQTLIFSTVSAFLQALSDRELIRVRAENLEGNRRQLEQVDALYRAGNRPVSDLYQQQAQTNSAELDLLIAERNYVVTKLQLLQTIGLSPTTAVEPQAPDLGGLEASLVARTEDPPSTTLALRADLLAKEKQIEAAREQIVQAEAGYWPTLNLSANIAADYTSLDRNAGFSDQFFDENLGGALGLNLSIPIFDRQQTRNLVAQARIRQMDARWSLLQSQLQAEAEFSQALQDFHTAQKLIGVTESQLTASRQALDAVEERYRVGASTLVELTQARAQFVAAGFERVKARYGLITQGVAVAYYQGDWEQMRSLLTLWETSQ
jgi:outer membrane protein